MLVPLLLLQICKAMPSSPPGSLAESKNFLIIQGPSDLAKRMSQVESMLYQGDQGQDNPLPSLVPATIALAPSTEPYKLGQLKLGYYTSIVGLGDQPDDVTIQGDLDVQGGIQSIDNVFYRSLENLKVDGDLKWTTAQACPARSLHVTGKLSLGGGVGGTLADSIVDGAIEDGGQQQYLFRNVSAKQLDGRKQGQMNFVFVDSQVPLPASSDLCAGSTSCGSYYPSKNNPAPSFAIDSSTLPRPIASKHKPRITADGVVMKDQKHTNFKQVRTQEEFDTVTSQLTSGTIVLLHPNVYRVKHSLKLAMDNIAIIGVGFPVLRSELSEATIEVSGANCVVASLIVDAPLLSFNQDVMIDVKGDGVEMYDIFARTFLAWTSPVEKYKTTTMLQVSGSHGFMENLWLWRGDHWSGPDLEGKSFGHVEWDPYNVNPYGLVVTEKGIGLTVLGGFVEHQVWNPIYWNGDDGVFIMSQGECAYTNNGNIKPEVVSSSVTPKKGLTPGVYYTVGANVKKHKYMGGGIYNIFGEQYTPGRFPAIEVQSGITSDIDIAHLDVAAWVGSGHFSSALLYKGKKYGPAMPGASGSFYLCNLTKLVGGSAPAPTPPPSCAGLQCMISKADYWGSLPGWPTGTQKQQYKPDMSPGDCCGLCNADKDCAYWKFGNSNCYYYTLPQSSRVSHDLWKNFTQSHPASMWTMGLRDDTCCSCPAGSQGACGPTSTLHNSDSALDVLV